MYWIETFTYITYHYNYYSEKENNPELIQASVMTFKVVKLKIHTVCIKMTMFSFFDDFLKNRASKKCCWFKVQLKYLI